MFSAWYDVEIIKRWGRWASSTFQQYIWRGQYVMPTIGRGIFDDIQWRSSSTGRSGGGGEVKKKGRRKGVHAVNQRMTDISHTMSRILRHKGMPEMRRDGFVTVRGLLNHPYKVEREAAELDIDGIVAGLGGNRKFKFERSTSHGGETHMIRATQCHSENSGVVDDIFPIDEEVLYAAHGTSLDAAMAIVLNGLGRFERIHVHFHKCTVAGHVLDGTQMRHNTQVAIVVSAAHAREEGIVFYRSSNDVILSAGANGIIHPRFSHRVIEYPSL